MDAEYVDGKLKSNAGSYVRVRTIRRGPEGFKETAHPEGVLAALISPDGRYLYTVGDEGGVEVAISRWSVETGAEDKDFRIETNHQGGVTSLCLFPDVAPPGSDAAVGVAAVTRATAARAGGRILTGGADGCVDLWTAERHGDGAQQLAAEIAQQEAAMAATGYQRAQVKLTALSPELPGRRWRRADARSFQLELVGSIDEERDEEGPRGFHGGGLRAAPRPRSSSRCAARTGCSSAEEAAGEQARDRGEGWFFGREGEGSIAAEGAWDWRSRRRAGRDRGSGNRIPEEKKKPASGGEGEASETELSEAVDDKKDEE